MENRSTIKDRLEIISTDPDGKVTHIKPLPLGGIGFKWVKFLKSIGLGKNYSNDIVVNAGLADIANMIKGRYVYMGFGTSSTPPAPGDTGCIGPSQDRVICTKTTVTTFYENDTIMFEAMYAASNERILAEASIHVLPESGAGDVCLCRETYTPVTVVSGTNTLFRWSVVVCR